MPLYDFKCCSCGDIFEEMVSSFGITTATCKKCAQPAFKIFSPPGFRPDVFPAEGVFLKNVCAGGKRFNSKSSMREYERTHDVEIGYLL